MKNWYIRNNDEHLGPYSVDELKMVGLYSDDYVWKDGLSKWTKANAVKELQESIIHVENSLFIASEEQSIDPMAPEFKKEQPGIEISRLFTGASRTISSMFKRMLY
jgi:hypothetical protein